MPVALVSAVTLRATTVETFFVPDDGMAPTVMAGERVLVSKVGGEPTRGDVVIVDVTDAFAGPSRATHEAQGVLGDLLSGTAKELGVRNGGRSVAARVVGIPGDRITCGPDDSIHIGVSAVSKPVGCEGVDVIVPPESVWVLGDDPKQAFDSLADVELGGTGVVPASDVVGRVLLRWWPVGRIGSIG